MTIRDLLARAVARHPKRVALRYPCDGTWHSIQYAALLARVKQLAEAFGRLGVRAGNDRVALILENGVDWVESYLALTGVAIQIVPLDPKLRADEVSYILMNSETSTVITDIRHRDLLASILPALPQLQRVVFAEDSCEAYEPMAGRACYNLEALRKQVASGGDSTFYDTHSVAPQEVASIIYTSGTTGKPKGAMLTHNNFCSDVEACLIMLKELATTADDFLVVLPLFHSFSFLANLVLPLHCAAGMLFVKSLKTLSEDIRFLRPTIVVAVPLLVEKVRDKIKAKVNSSRLARGLLQMGLGKLVGKGVLRGLGGRLRLFVVGGAPCPTQILHDFHRLGIVVLEGYGLTECSPVVSINPLDAPRRGTIGKQIANIEIRLAEPDEDGVGELQVRGPIVMKGYFKDIEATRAAFDGDWLKTGDLASMDADKYLTIRGRKKALIVNREGKNIYPEEIEQVMASHPFIADIVVLGYTVKRAPGERIGAIITPDFDAINATNNGEELPWSIVEKLIHRAVREKSKTLADYKHIRKVRVQCEPLERTSIQKVRRVLYQGTLDE